MAIWPDYVCRNPNCHSYGKSHPNCKCGPAMAEGGTVTHFCSGPNAHNSGCEYFKDGGDVSLAQPAQDPTPIIASILAHAGAHRLLSGRSLPQNTGRGLKAIQSMIEGLFSKQAADYHTPDKDERDRLRDYMKSGKFIDQPMTDGPQMMALGGNVRPPEHDMLINASRARVHNYLNSLRPADDHGGLIFDDHHPNKSKERFYDGALDIANKPLSVLKHTKDGTLMPQHVEHLNHLYPEVYEHLSKGITDRIMKAKLAGEKPDYKHRQMLSLFMGASLDSTLTPSSIQAAQAVFMRQSGKPQQQPQGQAKGGNKSKLDKASKALLTPDQSAISRQQNAR